MRQAYSLHTSGDLIADRRFAYAQSAREAGDHQAAAEIYAQGLELVPDWPPAHLELGKALAALGDVAGAAAAFKNALALDPQDRLGAGLHMAAIEGGNPHTGAMSDAFVAQLFDSYAPRFDVHLAEKLDYRAPALIRAAIERSAERHGRPLAFSRGLDLGCGTGLMGREIASWSARLDGVDLSENMLRQASETGLYASLACAGIDAFLDAELPECADLVLAADVFCYVPELAPILMQVRRVITRSGLFAFTVQTHPGHGVIVGADHRIHHAADVIRTLALENNFEVAFEQAASSRKDRGTEVPGAVFVLRPI